MNKSFFLIFLLIFLSSCNFENNVKITGFNIYSLYENRSMHVLELNLSSNSDKICRFDMLQKNRSSYLNESFYNNVSLGLNKIVRNITFSQGNSSFNLEFNCN